MLIPAPQPLFLILLSGALTLMASCFSFSQKGRNNDVDNSIALRFQDISQQKEVPDIKIEELFQDHFGFIWMGTPYSLVKYDGYEFISYNYMPNEQEVASSSFSFSVKAIAESPDGNLWVGCMGKGQGQPLLFRFDRKSEQLIPCLFDWEKEQSLISSSIRQILTSKGELWILGDEVYKISLEDLYKENYSRLQVFKNDIWRVPFNHLFEAPDGEIWVTGLNGLSRWEEKTGAFQFYPLKGENDGTTNVISDFTFLFASKQGWYWVFDLFHNRILRFFPESGRYEALDTNLLGGLVYMMSTSHNQIWMGTSNGPGAIYIFDPSNASIKRVEVQIDGQLFNFNTRVTSMLEDFSGNIWIGTDGGPLLKYNAQRNQFNWLRFNPNAAHSLKNNNISGVDQDQNGDYWISTLGGGVHQWKRDQNTIFHHFLPSKTPNKNEEKMVLGLEVTQDGKVWYGFEFFTASCFDPVSQTSTFYKTDGSIHSIYEDAQNRLWMTTWGGLLLFDPGSNALKEVAFKTDEESSAPYPPLAGIFQDSQGKLWLGCFGKNVHNLAGFFRYDPESGRTEVFDLPEAHSFTEDRYGNIWIGSQNGLYRYELKTGQFKRYAREDGLPSNTLSSVLLDDAGYLWMATRNGISRFDPEEETFRNYFKTDGIPGNTFHFMSGYKNQKGELFFPGYFGLLYFHPDSIKANTIPPKVAFTAIDLFGTPLSIEEKSPLKKHISLTKELRFSHHQNDLTIHYAGLHYKNPEKNRYQVKLEPYEQKWRDVKHQRFADYTNLDPGKYTFYVKAANSDGVWNEEPATLDIIISPPWYWNIWSIAIYVFFIALFSYWAYRYQLNRKLAIAEARRLRDLDEVKSNLYTNITHEFRTPLTVIKGIAGQISGHAKEKKLIQRNSDQLIELIDRMLDLARDEAGQLNLNLVQADILSYLRYITESFHSFAINQKINLNFYADAEQIVMDFDREKILRILSNLISNALKFTPEYGKVQIIARRKSAQNYGKNGSDFLALQVKDTGIGIAPDYLPHIFDRFYQADASTTRRAEGAGVGLALTKALIKKMNGEISVKSKEGEGAVFTILLPITNQAYLEKAFKEEELILPRHIISGLTTTEETKSPLDSTALQQDQPLLLIVEDNPDVTHYLTSCLQHSFQLIYARNGRQGIDQALQHIPDIIISDIMMPEVDGLQLCNSLKTDERTSHIPIILLTAKADQDSRVEGLERGADAYLAKPFDKKELMVRLNKLIELRKKLQNRYQGFGAIPIKRKDRYQQEDDFLEKVKKAIEENLDNPDFDVTQLYKALGVSRIQLYRKLKALTDHSPAQIIQNIRLQYARRLLTSTDLRVGEVADRTGFKDHSYFTKLYKEKFGELPSQTP